MRGAARLVCAIAALVSIGVAPRAGAVELAFTGALEIHIPTYPAIVVSGGGTATGTQGPTGQLTHLSIPANMFETAGIVIPVTDPGAAPVKGLQATLANGTGGFARAGDAFGGPLPLNGTIKICLFASCSVAVANIVIPANVIGTVATQPVTAAVNLTVKGAPWTVGTVDATPDPVTGSDGGLDLSLVTPIFVSTNIAPFAVVKPYGRLTFAFHDTGEDHCKNGFDDDGDGLADYPDDPGCSSADDPSERDDSLVCDDGVDNDGDGRVDANDPGCDGPADPSEHSPQLACDNELDDDGDGLADVADPGCANPADPSERSAVACDDGVHSDGDGLVDLDDPGCTGPADDSERGPGLVCDDGIDNDGDHLADFPDDPGCASIQDPSEHTAALVCDDGVDNDDDRAADYPGDPGCSSLDDPSEKSLALVCDDGLDNDFDGLADVPDDPGCNSPSDVSEQSPYYPCDNGLDDDGDGKIDSQQDPGCDAPDDPRESVDFADGGAHVISADSSPGDGIYVADEPLSSVPTSVYLVAGGAIAGDLVLADDAFLRASGGAIAGDLVARMDSEVHVLAAAIGGAIEAHDAATITIFGSGFDLPFGAVGALSGTITGFLANGTPFTWGFTRDAGASIVLAPEPGAASIAIAAIGALVALRRRR